MYIQCKREIQIQLNITHDVTNECYHHFSKSSIFFIACIPIRFTKKKTEVQKSKVWIKLIIDWQAVRHTLVGRASR